MRIWQKNLWLFLQSVSFTWTTRFLQQGITLTVCTPGILVEFFMWYFRIVTMWKMKTKGLQEERGLRVDVISAHIHITNITANFWGLFLQINHGLYASK